MNIAEAQLHQMARRHHAKMQKLDGIREKISGLSIRALSTLETGAGAWVGGLMDGKLQLPVNLSLMFGVGFILLEFTKPGERYRGHYGSIGNGFLGSYLARAGYRFGHRLRESRKGAS